MGVGSLSDWVMVALAHRNKGYKEPEMRLWVNAVPLLLAAAGYFLYGWSAHAGTHWMAIAVGLCCMIAQQVSATSIATAYAMECFDRVSTVHIPRPRHLANKMQISGELVVVLACCSSIINFAISFSVQPFINATNYGWTLTFFGILVVLSMVMTGPMLYWGKTWRRQCKERYVNFLRETGKGNF